MPKTVLAIDPGSSKCGMALVQRSDDGNITVLWRAIAPTPTVAQELDNAAKVEAYSMLIIGSGTTSRQLVHQIRESFPSLGILVVDEKDTTLQARERYWEHHPRRGWRRFVPSTMQVPPEPVDDFVALILAERVLAEH